MEISISRAELLARLPAAVAGDDYVEEGSTLVHREDGRRWTIVLEPLPALRIAMLSLERLRVTLRFENYAAAEVQRFLQRFRLYFQRGGG